MSMHVHVDSVATTRHHPDWGAGPLIAMDCEGSLSLTATGDGRLTYSNSGRISIHVPTEQAEALAHQILAAVGAPAVVPA